MRPKNNVPHFVLILFVFLFCQFSFGETSDWKTQLQPLSLEERVSCQKSIEEVYWRNTLWPAVNSEMKPGLESVMPMSSIRAKTKEYITKSNQLEAKGGHAITREQLQAEMERMVRETAAPEILKEIWAALHDDPYLIAECLARPTLVDRFTDQASGFKESLAKEEDHSQLSSGVSRQESAVSQSSSRTIFKARTAGATPNGRIDHTSVWTGTSLIVWGGYGFDTTGGLDYLDEGGIYNPSTNSWKSISTVGAPEKRSIHTAVWTGTEMIVWGGLSYDRSTGSVQFNNGGRYNPLNDSWKPTSTVRTPLGRDSHTAIWTGKEMIIWGGLGSPTGSGDLEILDTGGRYNPAKNSWKTIQQHEPRWQHTVVWTGKEMIVWGGRGRPGGVCCNEVNTGGRYDPKKNSWKQITTNSAPSARGGHSGVWTGTEMVIWGGGEAYDALIGGKTGGRYNPITDSWKSISLKKAPKPRLAHKAVWTGTEMIVWGGIDNSEICLKTGGRYDPSTNSWKPTKSKSAPLPRQYHSALWTGDRMIIWGGARTTPGQIELLTIGGLYNPLNNSWIATQ